MLMQMFCRSAKTLEEVRHDIVESYITGDTSLLKYHIPCISFLSDEKTACKILDECYNRDLDVVNVDYGAFSENVAQVEIF